MQNIKHGICKVDQTGATRTYQLLLCHSIEVSACASPHLNELRRVTDVHRRHLRGRKALRNGPAGARIILCPKGGGQHNPRRRSEGRGAGIRARRRRQLLHHVRTSLRRRASLSRCRRRRNLRATFSALQVATDATTPPTDKEDRVSVAAVWVELDGISGGGR